MKSYEGTDAFRYGYSEGWNEGYEQGFTDYMTGQWHFMSDAPGDETECPTEEGWYRIIDIEGTEMTDYFYAKPMLNGMGVGYWKNCRTQIKAWKKMKD